DVVARRLEAVGMGPFALDLHDKGSRASTVRAQVQAALEHAVAVDAEGSADGQGRRDGDDLRAARRTLARYADRLHAENAAGLSFYTARTATLAKRDGVPTLPVSPAFVAAASEETITAVRRALALLPDIADMVRPSPRHAWAFVDTAQVDLLAAQQVAAAVDSAVRELPSEPHLARVLREVRTPTDLDALAHLLSGPPTPLDVLDEVPTERWNVATTAVLSEVAAFSGAVHPGMELATPAALELPLAELYVAAQTAQAGRFLARRAGLKAVRDRLAPVLRPGVTVALRDVPELTARLWRLQTAAQGIVARASVIPGLAVPPTWNPLAEPERLVGQVEWLERAGTATDSASEFAVALRRWVVQGEGPDAAAGAAVARLRDTLTALLRVCRSSPRRLAEWAGDDGLVLRWQMTRPERGVEHTGLMSLRRWADLVDTLEPLRDAGLHEARALLVTGELPAEDAVRAFDRGLARASVAERRDASGLDDFDADAHERAITRFTAASRAVREHLRTALPAAVLAARPSVAADEEVGALQRELARARRGVGVRALLARYGRLVTTLMPCVLVSPDSVARFFPAEAGLFDLVVFDEASQIRVADAIGALGRARAAVVVGDSRQMPPTSFAEASTGSAEDDAVELLGTAVEDEESILSECVQARVPRQWLSWHYRSQDESLIAFSNATYYDNRLSSFPAPTHGRPSADVDGRGISLVRVNGTFHRSGAGRLLRTNPMEAKAVVAEVRRRFDAVPPDAGVGGDGTALPSIGVVTFNAQQRAYIEGLLRDAGDERLVEALDRTDGEGLFVKNLDNVQGDERDVVLFSTGFSVDDRGVLPLNFGPLNRVGGERRLNVAVTRARRQVVVVTSFDPAQLRAEQTSSVGVKHLRAYLDLAALGTDALPRDARPVAVPDRHREEIAAALRDRGLPVRTDVGLSEFRVDLSVARPDTPDEPVMAVLLDGPSWARRRTVGDRDGLPVEVLSGMLGWPVVERVWLPTWLRDREAVLDRLAAAVAAVPAAAPSAVEEPVAVAPVVVAPVVEAPVVEAPVVEAPAIPAPADPPASEVRAVAPLRAAPLAVVETVVPAVAPEGAGPVPAEPSEAVRP
ncbi:MAG TPA: AAA domain-containing protein, partial [Geodermatophilus sp.]|nr:AAA domain-containing protein [Geodermatophilus sp.]